MNTTALRSEPVAPLPIGSGGNSTTAKKMNNMNNSLTMMSVQSSADASYDPPVPQPRTESQLVQAFCSGTNEDTKKLAIVCGVIGCVSIVYGVIAK